MHAGFRASLSLRYMATFDFFLKAEQDGHTLCYSKVSIPIFRRFSMVKYKRDCALVGQSPVSEWRIAEEDDGCRYRRLAEQNIRPVLNPLAFPCIEFLIPAIQAKSFK